MATSFQQFLEGSIIAQHSKICWNITHVKLIAWEEGNQLYSLLERTEILRPLKYPGEEDKCEGS